MQQRELLLTSFFVNLCLFQLMETTLLTQHFFRMFSFYLHTLDRTIQFQNQNVPFRNLKNLICLHSKVLNIS